MTWGWTGASVEKPKVPDDPPLADWKAKHLKCGRWFDAKIGEHHVHWCRCGDRWPAVRG